VAIQMQLMREKNLQWTIKIILQALKALEIVILVVRIGSCSKTQIGDRKANLIEFRLNFALCNCNPKIK
jgi:hypothetical protein